MYNDSQCSKVYECSKVGKHSVCTVLFKTILDKYPRKYIGLYIDEKINHDTKEFIITNIFPDAKWPQWKNETLFKQSCKILIIDSSLKLEQIMKLIHIDITFKRVLNMVKLLHVPIILAGLKEI